MKNIYWFTGQAGSGKTVLAHLMKERLEQQLYSKGITKNVVIIDGDDIRELYKNTDYSIEGRTKNVDFVQNLCIFLMRNGIIPIVCMVSPFALQRRFFIEEYNGIEIFVHCSEERGRENFHVDYYEPPLIDFKHGIEVDTTNNTKLQSFNLLIKNLCRITL